MKDLDTLCPVRQPRREWFVGCFCSFGLDRSRFVFRVVRTRLGKVGQMWPGWCLEWSMTFGFGMRRSAFMIFQSWAERKGKSIFV